jgi:outer membrane protein assembly factor BamB
MDACIDSAGGFVFTDQGEEGRRTIRRLSFLGEPVAFEPESPHEDWNPSHLILARDGQILSIDGRGVLVKHDATTGAVLWSHEVVGGESERADLLGRPAEAEDGRIYVPNPAAGTVEVVEPDGSSHATLGRRGTKRGELAFPVGVAFAPGGVVLVLDRLKHSIVAYDADRRFVKEYGTYGFAPGSLYYPSAIGTFPDGRVYVAQGYQGRVQVFRFQDEADDSAPSEPATGEPAPATGEAEPATGEPEPATGG